MGKFLLKSCLGCRCYEGGWGSMNAVHTREMKKAAEEARQKYLDDHPELAGTVLKHDPVNLIGARG